MFRIAFLKNKNVYTTEHIVKVVINFDTSWIANFFGETQACASVATPQLIRVSSVPPFLLKYLKLHLKSKI